MSALSAVPATRVRRRRKFGEVSCTECTDQGNDFDLIPMVKMETRHSVDGSFGTVMNFGRSIIIVELWRLQAARYRTKLNFCVLFGKTTSEWKIFKILFRKDSSPHRRRVMFKFREIWPTGNR